MKTTMSEKCGLMCGRSETWLAARSTLPLPGMIKVGLRYRHVRVLHHYCYVPVPQIHLKLTMARRTHEENIEFKTEKWGLGLQSRLHTVP